MKRSAAVVVLALSLGLWTVPAHAVAPDQPPPGTVSMQYIRMGNTGVQGDWSEALFVGADGNPWIGGYDPTFEEGGLAQYRVAEDRFVNVSNVDLPILGSPNITGTARVRDITEAQGTIWFASGTGVFSMDPRLGTSSLRRWDLDGNAGFSGGAYDLDIAPDGTVWAAQGALVAQIDPRTGRATTWAENATSIAVQPRPDGSYSVFVSITEESTYRARRFDSATRAWSLFDTDAHVYWLGKDPTDGRGRLFAVRAVGPDANGETGYTFGSYAPDLSWTPTTLPDGLGAQYIQRLKGYGDGKVLVGYGDGHVWGWDGAAWTDLGVGGESNFGLGIQSVDLDEQTGTIWASGAQGARFRDPATGTWQRLRITNSSMGDNFPLGLDIGADGKVYVTQNVSTSVGGWAVWDGVRWKNNTQLGHGLPGTVPFEFPTASTNAILRRASGAVAIALTGGGLVQWDGAGYVDLNLPADTYSLAEDGLGRLWAGGSSAMNGYLEDGSWHSFADGTGALWGTDPVADPDHPGYVWAAGLGGTFWTNGTDTRSVPVGGRWVAPIGTRQAWVGSDEGLYRVDMAAGTWVRYPPAAVRGAETGAFGVSPDGLLWYMCDGDLCWLDTTSNAARPRTGIFHVVVEPQWGRLAWHPTHAEIRTVPGGYQIWMTTPSRGITLLTVTAIR
jgi:hypothetical protein